MIVKFPMVKRRALWRTILFYTRDISAVVHPFDVSESPLFLDKDHELSDVTGSSLMPPSRAQCSFSHWLLLIGNLSRNLGGPLAIPQ